MKNKGYITNKFHFYKYRIFLYLVIGIMNGCTMCDKYEYISHDAFVGSVDCMYFVSSDEGYIITHIGNLYDSIHNTYLYKTTNGGNHWKCVDTIYDCSFDKHAYLITSQNKLYASFHNGHLSNEYWNSYFGYFDLNTNEHHICYEVTTNGAGPFWQYKDSIFAIVFKDHKRQLIHYDAKLSTMIIDTFSYKMKDVAFYDSSYAFVTYDNELIFIDSQKRKPYITKNIVFDGIKALSNNQYLLIQWGDEESQLPLNFLLYSSGNEMDTIYSSNKYTLAKFADYNQYTIGQPIILFVKKNLQSCYDVIYSKDDGRSWSTLNLNIPQVSCHIYCHPYLYIYTQQGIIKVCL